MATEDSGAPEHTRDAAKAAHGTSPSPSPSLSPPPSASQSSPAPLPSPPSWPSPSPSAPATPGRVSAEITHESDTPGKAVNLTIDDGPEPIWTQKVLDVLKKYGAKATFCIIGSRAKEYPDLVRKVVAAGHRLCDHSVDHNTEMDRRPESYQQQQILDARKMIQDAAGPDAKVLYYRAPGGAFTPYSREVAASHGMRPLGWNVDTRDWTNPGTRKILDTAEHELHEGPTVLFHDGGGNRSQTVAALDQFLPWLKNQGYVFGYPKI
ncbi:polysaccharide deacetylase family protein [Streptomyces sp. UNOC14_S4]|nr:polysaccharide deacetylase family protein [Streptomyces sp. UNOC14_S4]